MGHLLFAESKTKNPGREFSLDVLAKSLWFQSNYVCGPGLASSSMDGNINDHPHWKDLQDKGAPNDHERSLTNCVARPR